MTREQLIDKHRELTLRMARITETKNNDYGSSDDPFANFREFGELGFLVRMSDKWKRIKTALYEKRDLQVADETIEDTLLDLANYCLLLLCWREEQQRPCPEQNLGMAVSIGSATQDLGKMFQPQ